MDENGGAVPERLRRPRTATGVLTVDPQGRILRASPGALEMLGVPPPGLGDSVASLPGLGSSELGPRLAEVVRAGQTAALPGLPVPGGPGDARVLDLELVPLRDASGRVAEVCVHLRDVAASSWNPSRADLFYQAFLHSSNAIEITDRDGVLVDVNPAFERTYGYSRAELIGQKPRIVRSPQTPPEVYEGMWQALLDPERGEWSGEIVNVDRPGREHPVLLTINAIRDRLGRLTHFIGVATDLSELRLLQLQTFRAERLASLGQLAAGVAHELNTPLANIQLIAESVKRKAPSPFAVQRAEAIARQVDSAARIVAGLLDFGRHHPPIVQETNFVSLVHDASEFVRGKQSADVEIVEEDERATLPVRVNRVQMIQVLVNLLNNAYDAMNGRGTIRLRTRSEGPWARFEIEDTGPGIPPSVMPHIFEPFFTTKTEGKGTGLGLAICHGIVSAHGGRIEARSPPGAGATFVVELPRSPPAERPRPRAGAPRRRPSKRARR